MITNQLVNQSIDFEREAIIGRQIETDINGEDNRIIQGKSIH